VRLVTTTQVSLDGVMQGMGGSSEDRRFGFERGGWALPLGDSESGAHILARYGTADAFLFGRVTYEIFASYWPEGLGGDGPLARALNDRPKYLASTTITEPTWAGTTVLGSDLAAAIRDLEGVVLVPGSGALVRWLLAHGLVDELELMILPVVVGQGMRLFPESGPDLALEVISSRVTPSGVAIVSYRPAGTPRYAG
jgi:dihydrofolate reductase